MFGANNKMAIRKQNLMKVVSYLSKWLACNWQYVDVGITGIIIIFYKKRKKVKVCHCQ
jgi:hypothetical protein